MREAIGDLLTAIAIVAVGLFGFAFVFRETDPATRAYREREIAIRLARAELWADVWFAVRVALLVILLAAMAAGVVFLWRWLWIRAGLVYARHGLYPQAVYHVLNEASNQPHAQVVAALTNGNLDRIPASAVRHITDPRHPEGLLPAPAGPADMPVDDVVTVDPIRAPHWMLIGSTGSGKSSASYLILDRIRRQVPSEFVICERDAINWNTQASTMTLEGYARALQAVDRERERRAEMLRAADVDHISRLASPPPYLVVLVEEAESIYSQLFTLSRRDATEYAATLRDLASLGRKTGIILVVATQTGTSQVFDVPTRKNVDNKLFFRSEPQVGDQWGIPRTAGLSTLPTGTAYSLRHGALVTFPRVPRPVLPLSAVYRESPVPQLPADAEADGLGDDDLPSTTTTPTTTGTTGESHYYRPTTGAPTTTVYRIDNGRVPTREEARLMRNHYAMTHSKTAVCMAFYGYKDGIVWEYVNRALEGVY